MDEKDYSLNEEEDIITLQNEKNEDVDFYHVATIDYKDNWYIFLEPVEEIEDIGEDEVLIFRLEEGEDGQDNIVPINSEEELQGVYNEYLKEVENIEDSCSCHEECDCSKKDNSKDKKCNCKKSDNHGDIETSCEHKCSSEKDCKNNCNANDKEEKSDKTKKCSAKGNCKGTQKGNCKNKKSEQI